MKILHVNTEKTQRGGERQTVLLIKGLMERGIGVSLLCRKGYPLESLAAKERIHTITVDSGCQTIRRLIADSRHYDIIHSHAAKAQGQVAISLLFSKRPHIYTRRVTFQPRRRLLTKLKYRFTDRIVCVSQAVKEVLLRYGIEGSKLSVIYDGVPERRDLDRSRAERLLRELNIPQGARIVGNIAALTSEKDHHTIIYAAAEVKDTYYLIFGEGILRNALQATIDRLNLGNRVFLVGFRENVEDFFTVFDVFVLPSIAEGLANVVLDAFLYRVPVITTPSGGLGELVFEGQTGSLIPVKDHRALADKITLLLTNRNEAKRLSDNAYALIEKKCTYERMVDEYVSAYDRCVSGATSHAL